MGSQISSQIQNEVKEGQKSVSSLKNDMISQQIELVRRMAERQIAMQVASVRELMVWFIPFTISSYVFLYKGYRKTNSWPVMFPLIPITFGFGYQLHYAYGSKTNKVKALAEQIMANEAHMMAVPEWPTTTNTLLQLDKKSSKRLQELPVLLNTDSQESATIPHQVSFVSSQDNPKSAPSQLSVSTSSKIEMVSDSDNNSTSVSENATSKSCSTYT